MKCLKLVVAALALAMPGMALAGGPPPADPAKPVDYCYRWYNDNFEVVGQQIVYCDQTSTFWGTITVYGEQEPVGCDSASQRSIDKWISTIN